jgi:uncharacterized phage protein gp47/JayE
MRTIAQWLVYIQTGINTIMTSIGKASFDFYDGDVSSVFTVIMAYCCNLIQSAVYWFIDQAFVTTSSGAYLARHAADEGVTINTGTKATGEVTFSRVTTTGSITLPIGTQVITDPSLYESLVFLTTEIATMGVGSASVTVDIEAFEEGSKYNLLPDSIRFFVVPTAGIDDITNSNATSGGLDADTDLTIRENTLGAKQHRARATEGAIEYACDLVAGVDSIYIENRPSGELVYNETDPEVVLNGTFTSITHNDYWYGTGIETSTPNDYIEFTFENETSITPSFIGQPNESIVEVYIDSVSQGQINIESGQVTFDGTEYITTTAVHTIKLKFISGGKMAIDCFRGYNTAKRDSVIKIYIDDGSGTATWTLLNAVIASVEDYRAAGIRYFVTRCEIYTLDMDVSVLWNTSVDKVTTKSQISTELSNWFATLKSGSTIFKGNLYGFFNYQTISSRNQILNTIINTPVTDVVLAPDTIVRLGTITYTDITA